MKMRRINLIPKRQSKMLSTLSLISLFVISFLAVAALSSFILLDKYNNLLELERDYNSALLTEEQFEQLLIDYDIKNFDIDYNILVSDLEYSKIDFIEFYGKLNPENMNNINGVFNDFYVSLEEKEVIVELEFTTNNHDVEYSNYLYNTFHSGNGISNTDSWLRNIKIVNQISTVDLTTIVTYELMINFEVYNNENS